MSDIRLFRIDDNGAYPLEGASVAVEKSLHALIERHLEPLLGVRFLASEYPTGREHGGRIDTLGLDDADCPVIVEYKRAVNENVINQGLFYLSWLLDHRGDFTLLVQQRLGADAAGRIEWRHPRLVCVAADFTRYDRHAIAQMPRNIDLVRYRRYGDDLLLLERVATSAVAPVTSTKSAAFVVSAASGANGPDEAEDGQETGDGPVVLRRLADSSQEVQDWFYALQAFALGLGDGVEQRTMDKYVAFRRLRSFMYMRPRQTLGRVVLDVPLDPAGVALEVGFTRATRGKWVQITVASAADVDRAQPLILRAYQES